MAHLEDLIRDQVEDVLAVDLGGVAAIAVMPAELLEVVVQVAHGCLLESEDAGTSVITAIPAMAGGSASSHAKARLPTAFPFCRVFRFPRMIH
jgi:hypothetical protein